MSRLELIGGLLIFIGIISMVVSIAFDDWRCSGDTERPPDTQGHPDP